MATNIGAGASAVPVLASSSQFNSAFVTWEKEFQRVCQSYRVTDILRLERRKSTASGGRQALQLLRTGFGSVSELTIRSTCQRCWTDFLQDGSTQRRRLS